MLSGEQLPTTITALRGGPTGGPLPRTPSTSPVGRRYALLAYCSVIVFSFVLRGWKMLALFVELPNWRGSTEMSIDPALRDSRMPYPAGSWLFLLLLLSEGSC